MQQFPLRMSFKVMVVSPQVSVVDAAGKEVLYVKQKAFALKEDVKVFSDQTMSKQLFQIKADKIIDFSANYSITTPEGVKIGNINRKGMKSLWSATYNIFDASGAQVGTLHEDNPWIKVLDSFLSQIPFLGMLVNPAYLIDFKGSTVFHLKKLPAVFEGKFELSKTGNTSDDEEKLLLPAIIMALMLERLRG